MNNDIIKVLHIASGDLWAGAEVQLATLATTQAAIPDVEVAVVLLNHGRLEQELLSAGLKVIVLDETKLNGFKILKSLISVMKELQPTVVHTHRNKENVLGSIAARFSAVQCCVRTAHGAPEHPPSWRKPAKWIHHQLNVLCGRWFQQRIFAVSEDLAKILRTTYPSQKVVVVENGINIEPLEAIERTLQDSKVHIGIVGRLVPVKRVDLFIQSAAYLIKDHPEIDAIFHIFGDGPLNDELQRLVEQLNISENVIFEGHSDKIHQDIKNMDMLMMTSDHEGLPMTLLEAMALKTPVIAHSTGGIPNVLDQGQCGILVEQHDAKGYAGAILALISDRAKRELLTEAASTRVNASYSAKSNARQYIDQYRKLRQIS